MTSNIPRLEMGFLEDLMRDWITIDGIVIEGHRVAIQPSTVYPYGTIEKQKPYFKERGLDLDGYFNGTINVSIAPSRFTLVSPEFTFPDVAWTELHPPELFSFSRCKIRCKGRTYGGMVYYPHPETKIRHLQIPTVGGVMTRFIPGVSYGDLVQLFLKKDEILIIKH